MTSVDASDEDFGCVINCAVRYALGRQTYIPERLVEYITPLLSNLSNKTIRNLERDLWAYKTEYRTNSATDANTNIWYGFLDDVKTELKMRLGK